MLSTVEDINLDPRRPFIRAQLQSIAIGVTLKLNVTDLQLATRLAVLAVGSGLTKPIDDLKNPILAAGDWAGETIMNGLTWDEDVIKTGTLDLDRDRLREVIGWFQRRGEALQPALGRLLKTSVTLPQWFKDLLLRGSRRR